MKVSCVLVVSFLFVVVPAVPTRAQESSRVRALDELAKEALTRGLSESRLFRSLVSELEASDLIVHVLTTLVLPPGTIGTTRLTSASGHHRYVRITIDTDLSPEERTSILGHELQHACEIARSRARNANGLRALYQLIGQRVSEWREAYDTRAAIEAGERVWFDLHHSHRRPSIGIQDR